MADSKYRLFTISAYISLRITISVSTYTFSETRIPLKLISNDFQPQLVSVAAIFFKMADPKYRIFSISASISLRVMILVSTYTFSETRIPLKLISNDFQPQLVSVAAILSKWPTQNTGFSISQPIFHLES